VPVAPAGIGLPDLDQGSRHRPGILVQHPAVDDDPLADRIAGFRVVADQVVVGCVYVGMAEDRAGDFRQRILQGQERQARAARDAGLVVGCQGWRLPGPVALIVFGGLHRWVSRFISAKVWRAILKAVLARGTPA